MSISTITVGGQSVTLVALPSAPGLREIEFSLSDTVGAVTSSFTGQTQAQQWPGADLISATLTLPPLTVTQADDWECFLMQLRGMSCAFQIGDPLRTSARGSVAGTPEIDNTATGGNAAMSQVLGLKGFTASATGVLRRGDWIQTGYRMYRVLDDVNADASGKASANIFPSIREVPVDGSALITSNCVGLFRLAQNKRGYSFDVGRLSKMSLQVKEYR